MKTEEEPVHGGDDETTAYDIQCRLTAQDDNGWVIVRVMLSEDGETLTVKFPGPFDTKWIITIGNFKSVAAVDEFLVRFRRVSKQLQDNECYKVIQGMTIAYTTDSRRFYDAVVDAVEHQSHSLTDGKEECLCTFRLTQLEVPRYTTSVKIANICTIQATAEVDPRIISFSKLVKERILAAYLNSCVVSEHSIPALGFGGPLSYKEAICLAVNQKSSSQSRPQDTEVGSCCRKRREDKERVNFTAQRDGDEDFGIADILESQGYHFLLIDNLEKDLSTSAIRQFIHGHTHVSPQAYLFPSRSSVSSGSGAIASDSKEKIEKIYEFLVHPKHLIVSARGRPWVVSEKVLNGLCRATPGSLLPGSQDELQLASLNKELKVVHFGTEAYKIAKQLRDLFLDFVDHEQLLRKRLVLEETKILKSSQSQETGTSMNFKQLHTIKAVAIEQATKKRIAAPKSLSGGTVSNESDSSSQPQEELQSSQPQQQQHSQSQPSSPQMPPPRLLKRTHPAASTQEGLKRRASSADPIPPSSVLADSNLLTALPVQMLQPLSGNVSHEAANFCSQWDLNINNQVITSSIAKQWLQHGLLPRDQQALQQYSNSEVADKLMLGASQVAALAFHAASIINRGGEKMKAEEELGSTQNGINLVMQNETSLQKHAQLLQGELQAKRSELKHNEDELKRAQDEIARLKTESAGFKSMAEQFRKRCEAAEAQCRFHKSEGYSLLLSNLFKSDAFMEFMVDLCSPVLKYGRSLGVKTMHELHLQHLRLEDLPGYSEEFKNQCNLQITKLIEGRINFPIQDYVPSTPTIEVEGQDEESIEMESGNF